MFRIRLHIDDIAVLHKICQFLGVGRVVIEGKSCVFIISDINSLLTVLFPLIDKYKLYTTKWLDSFGEDFKSVVLFLRTFCSQILQRSKARGTNLNTSSLRQLSLPFLFLFFI